MPAVDDADQGIKYRTYLVGLFFNDFKQYDKYHDTHEPIFNTYQQYSLSYFRPKNLISPDISWDLGNIIDKKYPKFKHKMYHFKYRLTKLNDTIYIAKVSIQRIYSR